MNLRTFLRYTFRGLLFLAAAILIYFLAALVLALIPSRANGNSCDSKPAFFVATNGVHLDIVVPRSFFEEGEWPGISVPTAVKYVAVGWGDKGFYLETPTWGDLKFSTALRALFWKSETAMHLTYYYQSRPEWRALPLCPEQVQSLQEYMHASFEKTEDGQVLEILGAGYTRMDVFFEAKGNYSVLRTCNNWANQALKAAEVKTALWSPFDWGVLRYR